MNKYPTKFQESWSYLTELMPYLMFGWLAEMEPPEWRIILLPFALLTCIFFAIPCLFFMTLDMLVNGEFYQD